MPSSLINFEKVFSQWVCILSSTAQNGIIIPNYPWDEGYLERYLKNIEVKASDNPFSEGFRKGKYCLMKQPQFCISRLLIPSFERCCKGTMKSVRITCLSSYSTLVLNFYNKGHFFFVLMKYLGFGMLLEFIDGLLNSRGSRSEVFLVKGVLKICSKFTGEYPCRSEKCKATLLKPHFWAAASESLI